MGANVMSKHIRKRFGHEPNDNQPIPTVSAIKAAVARDVGLPLRRMTDHSRKWKFSRPRQIAMYLACEMTWHSYPAIARIFGGYDHTTILHAHRIVRARMEADQELEMRVNRLEREILEQVAYRTPVAPVTILSILQITQLEAAA
ncbi:MAG: helix-turn-helix domain-containing protein [Rhizomicrobium sp.]